MLADASHDYDTCADSDTNIVQEEESKFNSLVSTHDMIMRPLAPLW
jgi:hypothetical protein